MQQSPEEETPFVYVTLATAGYTPCLFGYVTIGLARHNRTHFSQSERLLVKPKRPCTDLCAEPVGVWNRLIADGKLTLEVMAWVPSVNKPLPEPVLTQIFGSRALWLVLLEPIYGIHQLVYIYQIGNRRLNTLDVHGKMWSREAFQKTRMSS